MNWRALGKTDLQVSVLGLGTVQLGLPYGIGLPDPPSDRECIELLHHALDTGINYFDTAPVYGRSEELLGKAFGTVTPKPIIATKVIIKGHPDAASLQGATPRQQLEESVISSLKRLGLEALDLLQIHSAEAAYMGPELLEAMDDLSSRGLVRYWGATTYGETNAMDVLALPGSFYTLQVAYSMLDRQQEKKVFLCCREQGTGLVLRSVFLKGVLSGRALDLPAELSGLRREALKANQIAASAGMDLPELALRFATFCPYAHTTLFGTTSIAETQANLAAVKKGPLPPEVLEQLNNLRVNDEQLLNPVYSTTGWAIS